MGSGLAFCVERRFSTLTYHELYDTTITIRSFRDSRGSRENSHRAIQHRNDMYVIFHRLLSGETNNWLARSSPRYKSINSLTQRHFQLQFTNEEKLPEPALPSLSRPRPGLIHRNFRGQPNDLSHHRISDMYYSG